MSKAKKEKVVEDQDMPLGAVIYADGSCRPNPGPGGWGIHGYLYKAIEPKKGSGNPTELLTAEGYVQKTAANNAKAVEEADSDIGQQLRQSSKVKQVTPVHYVDGFGSFIDPITNNIGELVAATKALQYAADYNVNKVGVYTDSEYVIKGIETRVNHWQKNGWLLQDGTPVKNLTMWKDLVNARDNLTNRGVKVKFNWIKGHADLLGNETADKLARVGTSVSRGRQSANEITSTPADGYWKYVVDRDPLIMNRRLYFNSQPALNKPGVYYMGEHGKDDELLGKRTSDGCFSVVRLKNPDPAIEIVRNAHTESAGRADVIIMLRLDRLYSPDTHRDLMRYGMHVFERPNLLKLEWMVPNVTPLDEEDEKKPSKKWEPLSRQMSPPGLAQRAVDALEGLDKCLEKYLQNSSDVVVTDLTPHLYETTEKVSKKGTEKVTTLKAEYTVGYAVLKTKAKYRVGEKDEGEAEVALVLGIDMLDRNSLKRLENSNPKVKLITWLEAAGIFRYATVVEHDNGVGIYAGVYSNTRIV